MTPAPSRYLRAVPVTVAVLAIGIALWLAREPRTHGPRPGRAEITGTTMGPIDFQIQILHDALMERQVTQALQQASDCLDRVDQTMSAYRAESDVGRLNGSPAGVNVSLDEELAKLLDQARRLTLLTEGAFDPTARSLFQLWRRTGDEGRLPTRSEIETARTLAGWDKLALDLEAATAAKAVDGLQLDLGAIAKGYAVDLALERLRRAGAVGGLVEVGGEVRVFGEAPGGEGWIIGIRHPFRPQGLCGRLALRNEAAATSGNYFRYTEIQGHRYSHIVDPRTGRPADAAASVTVIAPDCTTADAWATALGVLGEAGLARIEALEGVEAMMVLGTASEFRVLMTGEFADYLAEGEPISLE